MTITTIGIDIGSGAVKSVLFRSSGDQHEWLAKRLNDMRRVFADRVKALDADQWRPESAS